MARARRGRPYVAGAALLFASAFPAGPSAPSPTSAPSPGEPADFRVVEAKPGVFAAIADPRRGGAVGNAGFVVGSDAVLVVDAFATEAAARSLLAEIRRRTRLPIRWLVDTHHHRDHCGGNAVFARAGAAVVASEPARERMREKLPPAALPSLTYRDSISIWLGDRRVDVFTKPGHTPGDSLVSIPDADALFGGDLLQKATVPNLADADSEAWVKTLDELARRFPSATLIPGHGDVARPLDMRALRAYLVGLRAAVAGELRRGKSGAALVEAVLPAFAPSYRGWAWSESIPESVAQMERELTGKTGSRPAPTP